MAHLRFLHKVGGPVHPDHMVANHLAALRADHLLEVVQALELMIEKGTRQWFVLGDGQSLPWIDPSRTGAGIVPTAKYQFLNPDLGVMPEPRGKGRPPNKAREGPKRGGPP